MRTLRWLGLIVLVGLPLGQVQAQGWRKDSSDVAQANDKLAGKVIDHTANHGKDNRIWSPSLFQRRDLYVYLPPGFQPCQRYPLMLWLHGLGQDEKVFLQHIAPVIDEAIKCGKLPPLIVAAPDGTFKGEPHPGQAGSFFINTEAGDYGDFVLYDVFDFVCDHYPIRAEREAHILAGTSMGGFAAFNHGIKHREAFGVVIGLSPLLNLRWQNKHGEYQAKFNPRDWGWATEVGGKHNLVSHLLDAGKHVCLRDWLEPLYGPGDGGISMIAYENPIELVDRCQLRPGQLEMYVAYTADDEFNADAQTESFLYLARWRGLCVGVGFEELGRNNIHTAAHMLPGALAWLTPRIAPFSPLMPVACPVGACPSCPDGACAPACPDGACAPACPAGACAPPKHRLLGAHAAQPVPPCPDCCTDLSCHLPPTFLPDRVPEGK